MTTRRMRMAELVRLSGVARETIHYYAREGLLPAPERSGRTSAYYTDVHLERLELIRRLREEKYLPVAVIKRILDAGLEGSAGSDLDTLADVLRIERTNSDRELSALDPEVERLARQRGLVGAEPVDAADPSVRRMLDAVGEALALDEDARALTLDDMAASAPEVRRLVEAEARVFFDRVLDWGDAPGAIRSLRAGRAAVARFIAAQRDLGLRRVVDELLAAVQDASARVTNARALPLSEALSTQLGAEPRRLELTERASRGDEAAANDLVWHLFAVGPSRELSQLPAQALPALRPRAALLLAHARLERGSGSPAELEASLERAAGFPLGQVLMGEAALLQALGRTRSGPGLLELAVPALSRIFSATPGTDADPLAASLASLRRGLIGLALPKSLGRTERAEGDLEHAITVVASAPGRLHPAARARIEANARLALGRSWLLRGREADGREQLGRARAIDASGPIGEAAESAMGPQMLADSTWPR